MLNVPPVRDQSLTVRLPAPPMLPSASSILPTVFVPVAVRDPLLIMDPLPVIVAPESVSKPSLSNSRSSAREPLNVPVRPALRKKVPPPFAIAPPLHVSEPLGPPMDTIPAPDRLPPEIVSELLKVDALVSVNDPLESSIGWREIRLFAAAAPPDTEIVPVAVWIVTSLVPSGTRSPLQLSGLNQLRSLPPPSQYSPVSEVQPVPVHVKVPLPTLIEPLGPRITFAAWIVRSLPEVPSVWLTLRSPLVLMTMSWKLVRGLESVMPPLPAISSKELPESAES